MVTKPSELGRRVRRHSSEAGAGEPLDRDYLPFGRDATVRNAGGVRLVADGHPWVNVAHQSRTLGPTRFASSRTNSRSPSTNCRPDSDRTTTSTHDRTLGHATRRARSARPQADVDLEKRRPASGVTGMRPQHLSASAAPLIWMRRSPGGTLRSCCVAARNEAVSCRFRPEP